MVVRTVPSLHHIGETFYLGGTTTMVLAALTLVPVILML